MPYRLFLILGFIFIFIFAPFTSQAASVEMMRLSNALLAEAQAAFTQASSAKDKAKNEQFMQIDAQLTHALLANPANAEAFILKGRIAALQNDPAEARRFIDLGLNIQPDHLEAILWAGQAALALDDRPDAEKRLKRLVKLCGTCDAQKQLQKEMTLSAAKKVAAKTQAAKTQIDKTQAKKNKPKP